MLSLPTSWCFESDICGSYTYKIIVHVDLQDFAKKHIDQKINIIVEKVHQFSFNSFVRGYHAYMEVRSPNVGDENLYLKPEDGNKYGKNAVVVIIDGKLVDIFRKI